MLNSTKNYLKTLNESEALSRKLTEARKNAEVNNKVAPRGGEAQNKGVVFNKDIKTKRNRVRRDGDNTIDPKTWNKTEYKNYEKFPNQDSREYKFNKDAVKVAKKFKKDVEDSNELNNEEKKDLTNQWDKHIADVENKNKEILKRRNIKEGVNDTVNEMWDILIDMGISEETLQIITSINGYNEDTLKDVLYAAFGYRDFDQLDESCKKDK